MLSKSGIDRSVLSIDALNKIIPNKNQQTTYIKYLNALKDVNGSFVFYNKK
jgi:hypothetical protein